MSFYDPTQTQILEKAARRKGWVKSPAWSALLWSMILSSPRLTILLNAMSVIADEHNILLYQSYVIQGLQIQKKFHFALVPKLKFLFLHPDCTNLSFPHIETISGFHDSATWERLCFVSTLPLSLNKYIAWVFLLWLFKYILSILKAPNLYLVSSSYNWCRCFWYRPSLVCIQHQWIQRRTETQGPRSIYHVESLLPDPSAVPGLAGTALGKHVNSVLTEILRDVWDFLLFCR